VKFSFGCVRSWRGAGGNPRIEAKMRDSALMQPMIDPSYGPVRTRKAKRVRRVLSESSFGCRGQPLADSGAETTRASHASNLIFSCDTGLLKRIYEDILFLESTVVTSTAEHLHFQP
jgi:hypothetical protein